MNNSELVTANKITKELIGNFLFWGLILHFISFVIIRVINNQIDTKFFLIIIALILNFIIIFYIWKISTEITLKNKMISYNDLPKVIKNITIFTIIFCMIIAAINFSIAQEAFKRTSEDARKMGFLIGKIYTENDKEIFEKEANESIRKLKKEIYTYLSVFQILLTIIYFYMITVEKKRLLDYVAIDQNYLENINHF